MDFVKHWFSWFIWWTKVGWVSRKPFLAALIRTARRLIDIYIANYDVYIPSYSPLHGIYCYSLTIRIRTHSTTFRTTLFLKSVFTPKEKEKTFLLMGVNFERNSTYIIWSLYWSINCFILISNFVCVRIKTITRSHPARMKVASACQKIICSFSNSVYIIH
jgi:hypothetical protein